MQVILEDQLNDSCKIVFFPLTCIKYAHFTFAASSSLLYTSCFPGGHVLAVLDDVDRGGCGLDLGLLDEDGGVDAQLGKVAHDGPMTVPFRKTDSCTMSKGNGVLAQKLLRVAHQDFALEMWSFSTLLT